MVSFTVYKYTSSFFTSFQKRGMGGKAASDLGGYAFAHDRLKN